MDPTQLHPFGGRRIHVPCGLARPLCLWTSNHLNKITEEIQKTWARIEPKVEHKLLNKSGLGAS